jgi:hypothetical protein
MTITSFTYVAPINFTVTGAASATTADVTVGTSLVGADVPNTVATKITKTELETLFSGTVGTVSNAIKASLELAQTKEDLLVKVNSKYELDKQWSAMVYTIDLTTFLTKIAGVDPGITADKDDIVQFVFNFKDDTVGGTAGNYTVGVKFTVA